MRWTYKLLIFFYIFITTQSVARPITHAVGLADNFQLSRREPTGPATRSQTQPRRSPRHRGAITAPALKARPKPKTKKRAKKKPIDGDIKAAQLKSYNYRKVAISHTGQTGKDWSSHEADHLLEAQTVSHYLNKHRKGQPLTTRCIEATKKILNHPTNLRMLHEDHNQHKGAVVTKLIDGKIDDKFKGPVKNYVRINAHAIRKTSRDLDDLFHPKRECGGMHPPKAGDKISDAAERMIKHALKS